MTSGTSTPSRRILLMCPHVFYPQVVEELQRSGVEVAVIYFTELPGLEAQLRALAPRALMLPSFKLHRPDLLPGWNTRVSPATRADVEALAPHESTVLHMMDRRNDAGKSVQELRYLYLRYVAFWASVLGEHAIDAIVLHGTPHQGHDFVLFQLARHRGLETLMLENTRLDERLYVRRDLEDSPCPSAEELRTAAAGLTQRQPEAEVTQRNYRALNEKLNDTVAIAAELSVKGLMASVLSPRQLLSAARRVSDSMHALAQNEPRALVFRARRAAARIEIRRAFDFYRGLARRPLTLDAPYVYVPLHYQPERTTLPNAGRFADQNYFVEVVAAALPRGWQLLVKEHPRQFRQGRLWRKVRSLEFYERLMRIPAVRFVPLDADTPPLLKKARAAITATGTSAWEAVQLGTPGVVFGNAWYRHCPGIFHATDIDDTRRHLAELERGARPIDVKLVEAFKQVVGERYTFRASFSETLLAAAGRPPEENGRAIGRELAALLLRQRPLQVAS